MGCRAGCTYCCGNVEMPWNECGYLAGNTEVRSMAGHQIQLYSRPGPTRRAFVVNASWACASSVNALLRAVAPTMSPLCAKRQQQPKLHLLLCIVVVWLAESVHFAAAHVHQPGTCGIVTQHSDNIDKAAGSRRRQLAGRKASVGPRVHLAPATGTHPRDSRPAQMP